MLTDMFSIVSTAGKEVEKPDAPQCSSDCIREALESLAESMQSIRLFSCIIKDTACGRSKQYTLTVGSKAQGSQWESFVSFNGL